MTPAELLVALRGRGVRLRVVGDRLRVNAPAGQLSEDDWNTLAAYKPALLALLQPERETSTPVGLDAETAAAVALVEDVFPGTTVVVCAHCGGTVWRSEAVGRLRTTEGRA